MTNWLARLRRAARQPAPPSRADSCIIGRCDCSFRSGSPGFMRVLLPGQMHAAHPEFPEPEHPGRRPAHWVTVSVEEAYVHCRKHLPRLVSQPVARYWGTDNQLAKGGDYFGVAASRRAEKISDAAT